MKFWNVFWFVNRFFQSVPWGYIYENKLPALVIFIDCCKYPSKTFLLTSVEALYSFWQMVLFIINRLEMLLTFTECLSVFSTPCRFFIRDTHFSHKYILEKLPAHFQDFVQYIYLYIFVYPQDLFWLFIASKTAFAYQILFAWRFLFEVEFDIKF